MSEKEYYELVEAVVNKLREKRFHLTAYESCTGGFLLSSITSISHSSEITEGGVVTYSNNMKRSHGVSEHITDTYGIYSPETAEAMAHAAIGTYPYPNRILAIGITGTIGRKDPTNEDSVESEIHYCVMHSEKGPVIRRTMHVDLSREIYERKRDICTQIMKDLLYYLKSEA